MTKIYFIKKGDTLSSIADEFKVSKSILLRDNDLSPNQSLVEGQTLIIAYPEQTYTIRDGDTMESIAAI